MATLSSTGVTFHFASQMQLFDFGYLAPQKLHVVRLCTAILSQLISLKQQSTDTNSVDVRTEKEAKLGNERS